MTLTAERDAAAPWPDRVNIIGVGVSAASIPRALATFDGWIASGARHYVCVADVHAVMQAHWSADLRQVMNGAGMVTSDGMPLVWLCRRARGPEVQRVYGPDLLLAACEHGLARGRRHFFYGGGEGVADRLARRLHERFPGVAIVGAYSPPFRPMTEEETASAVKMINAAKADYVWMGLGAPKQEYLMRQLRPHLTAPILIGVGAAFDFHSGAKAQAPKPLRNMGLEWLFRLATEPARLWPRYSRVIPSFLYHLARQKLSPSKYPMA